MVSDPTQVISEKNIYLQGDAKLCPWGARGEWLSTSPHFPIKYTTGESHSHVRTANEKIHATFTWGQIEG